MTPGRSLFAEATRRSIAPAARIAPARDDAPQAWRGSNSAVATVSRRARPRRKRLRRRLPNSRARRAHCRHRAQFGTNSASPGRDRLASMLRRSARQPPPNTKSSSAEDRPRAGARPPRAAAKPAGPAPITSTSQWRHAVLVSIRIGLPACAAQSRGATDQRLIDLFPESRRPHERLVVEARRMNRDEKHRLSRACRRPAKAIGSGCGPHPVDEFDDRRGRVRFAARANCELDQGVRFFRPCASSRRAGGDT